MYFLFPCVDTCACVLTPPSLFLFNKDFGKKNNEIYTISSSWTKMPTAHRSLKVVFSWHSQSYLLGMAFSLEPLCRVLQDLGAQSKDASILKTWSLKKSNLPCNPFGILKIVSEFSVQSKWLFGRQTVSPDHQGIFISSWDYSKIHCRLVWTIIFECVFESNLWHIINHGSTLTISECSCLWQALNMLLLQ